MTGHFIIIQYEDGLPPRYFSHREGGRRAGWVYHWTFNVDYACPFYTDHDGIVMIRAMKEDSDVDLGCISLTDLNYHLECLNGESPEKAYDRAMSIL